jgi:hypothetical protein
MPVDRRLAVNTKRQTVNRLNINRLRFLNQANKKAEILKDGRESYLYQISQKSIHAQLLSCNKGWRDRCPHPFTSTFFRQGIPLPDFGRRLRFPLHRVQLTINRRCVRYFSSSPLIPPRNNISSVPVTLK